MGVVRCKRLTESSRYATGIPMFVFLALHNVEYEDRELTLSLEMLMAVGLNLKLMGLVW